MTSNMAHFSDAETNGTKLSSSKRTRNEKCLLIAVIILVILLLIFVIVVIVLALAASKHTPPNDKCTTPGCLSTALELLESMNTSVDPCEDFYQFTCGKWIASNEPPGDSKMVKAQIRGLFKLSDDILRAFQDQEVPDGVKKIAYAYDICGKYGNLNAEGKEWLRQALDSVGGWPMADKSWDERQYHWERNLAEALHSLVITTPIAAYVDVNSFDTTKFIIQIQQHSSEEETPLDKDEIIVIAKVLGNRNDDRAIEKDYDEMIEFKEELKKITRKDREVEEDPNELKELTIKELMDEIPWINWLEFIRSIYGPFLKFQINDSEHVFLTGHTYVSKFLKMMFETDRYKRLLANYIAVHFVHDLFSVHDQLSVSTSLLPTKIPARDVLKTGAPIGFAQSCLDFYSKKASPAIDFITHKYRKTPTMDDKMLDYAFKAMRYVMEKATWLDVKTKAAALEKLNTMVHHSGFPQIAKDPKKVEQYFMELPNMTTNALRNILEVQRYAFKKQVENLRTKVDRNRWPSTEGAYASQFNAFNIPEYNAIMIPAGIQTAPCYVPDRPKFWNFGSLGMILGHEITHSFDTSGSKRDKHGNLKNWWQSKSKEEFDARSKCFIEQYDKFDLGYKGHHVNGTQTIADNIADNGGLHQSFVAYKEWEKENGKEKRLPGLEKYDTHQLFFIAAAQPWCSLVLPPENLYESAANDEHSPSQFRIAGAVVNSEDFANTFKCKSGTPMNPKKKCLIW